MIGVRIREHRAAVEAQVGGEAAFFSTRVTDDFQGQIGWGDMDAVFNLENNPRGARRADVWVFDLLDGKRGFFAVAHTQINSPEAAIRAAIMEKKPGGSE
jgi:hypothetical protein